MSTVIKFKKSSDFESTKKISNQLLSDKEVRRIFQFTDYDILAYKVLDNDVNEYLDFDFKDLNDLDKTKNIYMRVQVLSNPNLLPAQREELLPEFSKNSFTTASIPQVSYPSSVPMLSKENIANEIFIKDESYIMDKTLQIEIFDHMLEDIEKVGKQIHDKIIEPNSNLVNLTETYKFPLDEIFQFPNLCSVLDSKSLMMGYEDTLLRILYDSIKRQSSNHAISYDNVIDSLFFHFPYLAESYGDLTKSRKIWKVKLTTKFANERRSFISSLNSQETRTLDDSGFSSPPIDNITCTSTTKISMSEPLDYNIQEEICSPSYKNKTKKRDFERKKGLIVYKNMENYERGSCKHIECSAEDARCPAYKGPPHDMPQTCLYCGHFPRDHVLTNAANVASTSKQNYYASTERGTNTIPVSVESEGKNMKIQENTQKDKEEIDQAYLPTEFSSFCLPLLNGEATTSKRTKQMEKCLLKEIILFLDKNNLIVESNHVENKFKYLKLAQQLETKYPHLETSADGSHESVRSYNKSKHNEFIKKISSHRRQKRYLINKASLLK